MTTDVGLWMEELFSGTLWWLGLFCVKGEFVCPLGINLDRTACLNLRERPECEKGR